MDDAANCLPALLNTAANVTYRSLLLLVKLMTYCDVLHAQAVVGSVLRQVQRTLRSGLQNPDSRLLSWTEMSLRQLPVAGKDVLMQEAVADWSPLESAIFDATCSILL